MGVILHRIHRFCLPYGREGHSGRGLYKGHGRSSQNSACLKFKLKLVKQGLGLDVINKFLKP